MLKLKNLIRKSHNKVRPNTPLIKVWDLLTTHYISLLPVVEENGILAGVIHEEDLLYKLVPDYREFFSEFLESSPTMEDVESKFKREMCKCAKDVHNVKVISIDHNQEVFKALSKMMAYHVKQLPVVDGDRYVGMVFQSDIVNMLLKRHRKGLKDKKRSGRK